MRKGQLARVGAASASAEPFSGAQGSYLAAAHEARRQVKELTHAPTGATLAQ